LAETIQFPTERRHQSWVLLTVLFVLASFLEVAVVAHFILFTPTYLAGIGFTESEINAWTGPIASAGFILGIWFVPFWGVLADRYGRKPLILRSYYVEVIAMGLAAVSHDVWLYMFARSLTGFALGNTGLMYASLTEAAPRNRVALALGLVNGSAPLGSLVGAYLGGLIVTQYGINLLFGVDAVVALLIAVMLTVFYRESFVRKPTPPIKTMLAEALRAVVRSPVAATIFVASFVSNVAFFFSYTYLPVRIGEIVGTAAAPNAIGVTQGIAGLATLVGSALWGAIADRVGLRRLLIALMFVVMVLWLPMYFAQTIAQVAVVWALFNLVNPSIGSLMFTIISLNVPADKRASILSMIYLPLNFAFVVGPFTAAFVATNLQVRDVFLVSAVLSLLALFVFVVNLRRTREEPSVATL
jgi:DHA1 family multidrug resistance protein-like MFS transporter